ncbi:Prolyl oligopeptidase family protein [Arabidopsis thaliana]|uniref:Prolyl endopeptidase n=3 Tax=Arabidopsis thaliana TaxID=3702 RepID=F4I2A0_ARATH|nr:Prolyl oligopeptidase family protein [Arabidopsis thaliana]AEE35801.1 Prolyl oligopeptidase family protein [Arabidopsis thaliana]|eukprot:NP_177741.3 Prolyl oligopeptidase family protein [Arabidopsis thaliana]
MLTAFASHARSHVFAFVTVPTITRRLRINILRQSPLSSSLLLNETFSNRPNSVSRRCYCSSSAIMGSSSVFGEQLQYPATRRDDSVVDDYHGVKIGDPYRWLEDPDAEEVKEFVQSQVKLTDSVLEKCETKEKLRQNITKLIDHPRYDSPFRQGDKYFYFHNTGLQAQSVLYMQDNLDAEPEVLLDPNTLSDDGTVALNTFSVSEDAKYLAYGLSSSGSDWVTIKLMKIEDKKVEPDTLSWVKFTGITWTHDSKGFFYGRYPAPKEGEDIDAGTETNSNLYHELYYHFIGTDQSQDILCWRDNENPKYMFGAEVTDDGKYLIMSIGESCDPVNKLYYCDMTSLSGGLESFRGSSSFLPFIKLVDTFDAQYSVISNDETLFTFLTNKDAPKYKLVRVDLKEPNSWTDVVEEHEKDVLASACAVNGNHLVACYMSDVKHILQIRDLKSGSLLHQLPLDIGSVSDVSARRKDNTFFFSFTSFLTPGVIYKCDLANESPEVKVFREVTVPGFDREAFQAIQVFYPSKDGTKIPMFIVAKKDIKLDGSHPCLLYAYGGFNISITPSFSASRIVLSKHLGVVFCFANIRGGGEYGEEWHKAGSLAKKQNCFDDFISGAEYLVSAGYTQPSKLCIEGGSNGGLLVGACINQRPDLYGCALAHVGVMDMLRFHKFTIGHAWTSDYGCSENEEEFHWLIKYSPLHNVKRPWEQQTDHLVQYPSTMLLTADHDDRVVPLHSLKLLATLQHVLCTSLDNSPQMNPIIGRIEVKAGHGAGRPTQKMIDEAADRYSFMAKMVNASWTE